MSSRVFQSVIVQMKEATDRVIGVIDADSNVISCSDTSMIGEKWPEAVIKLNSTPDSIVVVDHKTFKPLVSWSAYFDYAVFAEGDDETARSLCVMAYVALHDTSGLNVFLSTTTMESGALLSLMTASGHFSPIIDVSLQEITFASASITPIIRSVASFI